MIGQYLKLLAIIVKHGRLRHSGYDFNAARRQSLNGLLRTLPELNPIVDKTVLDAEKASAPAKPSWWRNLYAQAAFVKSSFVGGGGHITLPSGRLSYIRNPKSASTSLCAALIQKLLPSSSISDLNTTAINHIADCLMHRNVTEADRANVYFTVVRNPFARLVSVYRDFFEHNTGNFIYQDYLWGIFTPKMTFEEFVARVRAIPDRLKDNHLKPQHYFLTHYTGQHLSPVVLMLEEKRTLHDFLHTHDLVLPVLNNSTAAYDYRSYYTPRIASMVYAIYEKDIHAFGYQAAYEHLLKSIGGPHAARP